jgi:hypothetical protein
VGVIVITIVIAILLGAAGWWAARGRRETSAPASSAKYTVPKPGVIEVARVDSANADLEERLWKLAFALPSSVSVADPQHAEVRDRVNAILQAEGLDPKYFPRRPTLLPQLLRAVDDPHAAIGTLSRMIAHDPVLTAEVLRLANSSLYRTAATPIETIQRAIVVLGVEALRGLVATAMLQPAFKATRSNFPRFPRMLWERTQRAARAAEVFALESRPQDRFEAQLAVLLNALGPLAVYGTVLDVYSRTPRLTPNPALCSSLIAALGAKTSMHIAGNWEASTRLMQAIGRSPAETLTLPVCIGELFGSLSLLASQQVMTREEACENALGVGMAVEQVNTIWDLLSMQVEEGLA